MRQITIRLQPNEDLREGIERIAREHDIRAGCILSIVGGVKNANLRMAGSTPEAQTMWEWNEPLEIVSGTGTISPDGCHIHASFSRTDGSVIGGHLRQGCIVALTAEIVLLIFDDVRYARERDEETGFPELVAVSRQ